MENNYLPANSGGPKKNLAWYFDLAKGFLKKHKEAAVVMLVTITLIGGYHFFFASNSTLLEGVIEGEVLSNAMKNEHLKERAELFSAYDFNGSYEKLVKLGKMPDDSTSSEVIARVKKVGAEVMCSWAVLSNQTNHPRRGDFDLVFLSGVTQNPLFVPLPTVAEYKEKYPSGYPVIGFFGYRSFVSVKSRPDLSGVNGCFSTFFDMVALNPGITDAQTYFDAVNKQLDGYFYGGEALEFPIGEVDQNSVAIILADAFPQP